MTRTLTPQKPGAPTTPAADGKIASIAALTVSEAVEALDDLDKTELQALLATEQQGDNRSTLTSAIERTIERRQLAEDSHVSEDIPAANRMEGDEWKYRDTPAKDVDPTKLERPVLTADGWLMPAPQAKAE